VIGWTRVAVPRSSVCARGERIVATVDALVDQLAVMRGAAMKAGQVLSTMGFPGLDEDQSAYLQSRLASLRDGAPAVSWKQMREVLASDWGEALERVLAHIDTEPATSASIGQVYRGRTQEGREVAIKVQYPGIAESVDADMRNLMLLSPLMPGLEVKVLVGELRERILEECDYELEAGNHRRLERFWREHPFVLVPAVHTELSRRRVLVSDWVDGITFDKVARQPDAVRDRYAEIVYRFFYGTALHLGSRWAIHIPATTFCGPDGRVAFFDFGMTRRLPTDYLRREALIACGVRVGDNDAVITGMRALGLPHRRARRGGRAAPARIHARGIVVAERRGAAATCARICGAAPSCCARPTAAGTSNSCGG